MLSQLSLALVSLLALLFLGLFGPASVAAAPVSLRTECTSSAVPCDGSGSWPCGKRAAPGVASPADGSFVRRTRLLRRPRGVTPPSTVPLASSQTLATPKYAPAQQLQAAMDEAAAYIKGPGASGARFAGTATEQLYNINKVWMRAADTMGIPKDEFNAWTFDEANFKKAMSMAMDALSKAARKAKSKVMVQNNLWDELAEKVIR